MPPADVTSIQQLAQEHLCDDSKVPLLQLTENELHLHQHVSENFPIPITWVRFSWSGGADIPLDVASHQSFFRTALYPMLRSPQLGDCR